MRRLLNIGRLLNRVVLHGESWGSALEQLGLKQETVQWVIRIARWTVSVGLAVWTYLGSGALPLAVIAGIVTFTALQMGGAARAIRLDLRQLRAEQIEHRPFLELAPPSRTSEEDEAEQRERQAAVSALTQLREFSRARFLPAFDQLIELLEEIRYPIRSTEPFGKLSSEMLYNEVIAKYRSNRRRLIEVMSDRDLLYRRHVIRACSEFASLYELYCRVDRYVVSVANEAKMSLNSTKKYQDWLKLHERFSDDLLPLAAKTEYERLSDAIDHAHEMFG